MQSLRSIVVKNGGLSVRIGQRDERATIAVTENAHELRETTGGIGNFASGLEKERKTYGMNAHHSIALRIGAINRIDLSHDGIHGATTEFVAKHENADFSVGLPIGANRINDAIHWIAVAEWPPVAHRIDDRLASTRRIGYPFASILLKHVAAIVIHDLNAFDLGIHVERFGQLLNRTIPVELLHAPRRIDNENDVLAIDRNAGNRVVVSATIVGL